RRVGRGRSPPAGARGGGRAPALAPASRRTADVALADPAAHGAYLAELGVEPSRVAVWHFGVEPEFTTPATRPPVPGQVLFYGRYLPLHGIDTIVDAAGLLGQRARFVLIGSGPERPRLEAAAARRGTPVPRRGEGPLAGVRGEASPPPLGHSGC